MSTITSFRFWVILFSILSVQIESPVHTFIIARSNQAIQNKDQDVEESSLIERQIIAPKVNKTATSVANNESENVSAIVKEIIDTELQMNKSNNFTTFVTEVTTLKEKWKTVSDVTYKVFKETIDKQNTSLGNKQQTRKEKTTPLVYGKNYSYRDPNRNIISLNKVINVSNNITRLPHLYNQINGEGNSSTSYGDKYKGDINSIDIQEKSNVLPLDYNKHSSKVGISSSTNKETKVHYFPSNEEKNNLNKLVIRDKNITTLKNNTQTNTIMKSDFYKNHSRNIITNSTTNKTAYNFNSSVNRFLINKENISDEIESADIKLNKKTVLTNYIHIHNSTGVPGEAILLLDSNVKLTTPKYDKHSTLAKSNTEYTTGNILSRRVQNVYNEDDDNYDYLSLPVSTVSLGVKPKSSQLFELQNDETRGIQTSSASTDLDTLHMSSLFTKHKDNSSVTPKTYIDDDTSPIEKLSHVVKKSYRSTIPFVIDSTSSNTTESAITDLKIFTSTDKNTALNITKKLESEKLLPPENVDFVSKADPRRPRVTLGNSLNITSQVLPWTESKNASSNSDTSHTHKSQTGIVSQSTTASKTTNLTSSRGGYLNITIEQKKNKEVIDKRNMNGTENKDKAELQSPNSQDARTQSQLADDEILEQLLKEKMLEENQVNADRPSVRDMKPPDVLSVQPISFEETKNSSIYSVSSNYKPLKKLVIQSPKPFLRDPDDNSWRNESISSLGIVFNPKNSSKSLKQVLKNKTETELITLAEKDKIDLSELRQKLGRIAEERKSKKKMSEKFDIFYNEYDDTTDKNHKIIQTIKNNEKSEATTATMPSVQPSLLTVSDIKQNFSLKNDKSKLFTRNKTKFLGRVAYYDILDDDVDFDYVANIDLKKFGVAETVKPLTLPRIENDKPISNYNLPGRKATVQYFPPKQKPMVNFDVYDNNFKDKVNLYVANEKSQTFDPMSVVTLPAYTTQGQGHNEQQSKERPLHYIAEKNKHYQQIPFKTLTKPKGDAEVVNQNENYDRVSYFSKNYRGFFNEAKDVDDELPVDYVQPDTKPPMMRNVHDDVRESKGINISPDTDYDYEMQFRRDVFNRFFDNFNKNIGVYRANLPILYNSSVVHRNTPETGKVIASSRAFLRRLYDMPATKYNARTLQDFPISVNTSLEVSPAYDVDYYVPDEEQLDEADPRSHYRYR